MNRALLLPAFLLALASTAACGGGDADAPRTGASTGAATASARGGDDTDSDMAEITGRRLDRAEVERWFQAQRNVYEAMRRDPAVAQQLEADGASDASDISLDDLEDRFEAVPAVRSAIEAAGIKTRDFGVILLALAQASAANAALEMGASRDSVLARTGVQPANLDFVRDNKAWLERLQAEMAALAPKDVDDEDEGGDA
ncbi:MAG TPA: hypothetical protein VFX39_04835 [Gemmatimonadaceae bacterium]|nr:hypothetical protein [Gemmatimonadaceae bacterium]